MKKLLKIIGISLAGIFLLIVFALVFLVNKEDLNFESNYNTIRTETLKKDKGLYVLYIFSPGCPAIEEEGPFMKKDLELLRANDIKYYLVADVIYNSRADSDLNEIKNKYDLQDEEIYLMDKDEFPTNGGLFNNKSRYSSFVNEITGNSEIPLGYINHITMNNGKLVSFAPFLEKEKLSLPKLN